MYQFKFYYKDGSISQTNLFCKKAEDLYNEFDGLMKWEDFYALSDKKLTTHEILETGFELFKKQKKKEYFRLEIVNDETNEVVDFIEF